MLFLSGLNSLWFHLSGSSRASMFSPCFCQLSCDITTKTFTAHFRSIFHSSIANVFVGFSFHSLTGVAAEELPTDRSVIISPTGQINKKIKRYPPVAPTDSFPTGPKKIVRYLLHSLLLTILSFVRQLGVCV